MWEFLFCGGHFVLVTTSENNRNRSPIVCFPKHRRYGPPMRWQSILRNDDDFWQFRAEIRGLLHAPMSRNLVSGFSKRPDAFFGFLFMPMQIKEASHFEPPSLTMFQGSLIQTSNDVLCRVS